MKKYCLLEEGFDFDSWAALARSDPDAFERCRVELLEKAIRLFPENKQRLNGLQCRIDLEREKARVPLNACIRLSDLMWNSFRELNDRLNNQPRLSVIHAVDTTAPPARILPFRSPPL